MKINLVFYLCLTFILFQFQNLYCQDNWSKIYDINRDSDSGWKILDIDDYYYIMSSNLCDGQSNFCTGLLKIDKKGNVIWKMELDSISPTTHDACFTTDENFLYLVLSYNYLPLSNFRLIKFDLNGKLIKEKQYPVYPVIRFGRNINYYNNKLYVNLSFWHDYKKHGADSSQVWTFDTEFNELTKFTHTENYFREELFNYDRCQDGNFYSTKICGNLDWRGFAKLYKFDSLGEIIWDRILNDTLDDMYFQHPDFSITKDSGCVVNWMQQRDYRFRDTAEFSSKIVKYDKNGNLQWTLPFYGKRDKNIFGTFVTKNGDIIICGNDHNPGIINKEQHYITGWLVRVSPEGLVKWDRRISEYRSLRSIRFHSGIEEEDGDLVICGNIGSISEDSTLLSANIYVVRLDSNGCFNGYCDDSLQIITAVKEYEKFPDQEKLFTFYPNPIIDHFILQSIQEIKLNTELILYNSEGKFVTNRYISEKKEIIHLNNYPKGKYYYRINTKDKTIQIGSLIVI
ncbi:MAG TPA: T9SS type A sorting domain-containing protein [Saprospiraceae bacterium]|nr:T9SS type A sorting domain-containing protein [Saprospiraceae bacterium]